MKRLVLVACVSLALAGPIPVYADGVSPDCHESVGMTCSPPPYRLGAAPEGQPGAHPVEYWPDTPADSMSAGCSMAFGPDQGAELAGVCNDSSDRKALFDCEAYVDYWQQTLTDDGGQTRFWWISESAARCPLANGSHENEMLGAIQNGRP